MKKLAVIAAVMILIFLFILPVCGAQETEGSLGQTLPDDIKELLPEGSDENKTDGFGVGYFLKLILELFVSSAPGVMKRFAALTGLLIVSSVAGTVRDSTQREELKNILGYICAVCVCGAVYTCVSGLFTEVSKFIGLLTDVMRYVIPALCVLFASQGSVTFSAVCGALLYAATAMLEAISGGFLFPLLKLSLCVSIGGTALGNNSFSGVYQMLKRTAVFVFSLIMTVFSLVLMVQGTVASSVDATLGRSVKFAVSNFIPIVGGAIGDALVSISGGISAVKSALGATGAAVIAVIMLVPLCSLALNKLMLDISSSLSSVLGLEKESRFLSEMTSLVGMLMAITAITAVFFILALIIAAGMGGVS